MKRNLSSEKRARQRSVGIEIIYSGPSVILFSLRCCQGPLNRRGIYRIIRLSELKGSSLVQSPNFTGGKIQAYFYKGNNTLWILLEDRHSGRSGDVELYLHTSVEMGQGRGSQSQGKSVVYKSYHNREKMESFFSAGRAEAAGPSRWMDSM